MDGSGLIRAMERKRDTLLKVVSELLNAIIDFTRTNISKDLKQLRRSVQVTCRERH